MSQCVWLGNKSVVRWIPRPMDPVARNISICGSAVWVAFDHFDLDLRHEIEWA